MEIKEILESMEVYHRLTEEEKEQVLKVARIESYPKDCVLHDHSSECLGLVRLLSGRLRVTMQGSDGREITIYSVEPGDCDILAAACVINQISFDSMMVADEPSEVLIIPALLVGRLQKDNIYLHSFIYELMAERFSDAMWTMQQIFFLKADQRVASGLLDEYARTDNTHLAMTQEQLAKLISSAREVVARILKRMEKDGLLKIGRGSIDLLDLDGLERVLG